MGGSSVSIGRNVLPGELLDLSVSLLAPQSYGVFQGFWQMRNPAGEYFGQVMWAGIQVPDPNPPIPPVPPAPPAPPEPPAPPASGPNLRADASYLTAGQCTAIRWDVDGVRAVYFFDGGNQIGVGGHDTRTVCPSQTTTYTLRVIHSDGSASDHSITINVSGGGSGNYYIDFWADQKEINRGECTTLRWEVEGVQAVYLNNEGVVGVGSRGVCPTESKTYRLTVVKMDGGTDTREVRIKVHQ